LFGQSHDFFLDLALWNGLPIGILFSIAFTVWIWKILVLTRTSYNAHVQTIVTILCLHSLIEFPIYYSYFLLPAGMLIGTLESQLEKKEAFMLPRYSGAALLAAGILVLTVSVRDYFLIERSFYALRYESRGYLTDQDRLTPKTWALNQLEEHLRISRSEPNPAVSQTELEHMEDVVRVTPGAYIMFKLALNYGLTGNQDKAKFWLNQICNKSFVKQCDEAKQKWQIAVEKYSGQKLMDWPLTQEY
jgi:hypothetical protein